MDVFNRDTGLKWRFKKKVITDPWRRSTLNDLTFYSPWNVDSIFTFGIEYDSKKNKQ